MAITREAVIEYLAAGTKEEANRIVRAADLSRGSLVSGFLSIMPISRFCHRVRRLPFRWYNLTGHEPEKLTVEDCYAYWWAQCLRTIRLHRQSLSFHLLRLAARSGQTPHVERSRHENEETYLFRLWYELRAFIIELQIDLSDACDIEGLSQADGKCILSLLDVAVLTGDPKLAKFLASLGVPRRLAFDVGDFISFNTGLVQARNVCVIEAAACAGIDLRLDVSCSSWDPLPWNILERAIAGKQKKAVDILRRYGFKQGSHFGSALMRVTGTQRCLNQMQFFLDIDRVGLAVYAGLDVQSIRVTPWHALWYSCLTHRSFAKSSIFGRIFDFPRWWWWKSEEKWRPGQTLLEVAINCGQKEIVTPLINLNIEATNLTSKQLQTCFLDEVEAWIMYPVYVSINAKSSSLEAGRAAFRKSRWQYHVLIMQIASWWQREPGGTGARVLVQHRNLIDVISAYAAPIPEFPEFNELAHSTATAVNDVSADGLPAVSGDFVHDGEDRCMSIHRTAERLQTDSEELFHGASVAEKKEDSEEARMPVDLSIATAQEEEASHLSQALLQSKADVMALSGEDVVIARLTARTTQVAEVLRTAACLKDCHDRVTEANCEIFPAWAKGACLLVPLTHGQMVEADIELQAHHIVALRSDLPSIQSALSLLSKRQRPKLRPEYHAHDPGHNTNRMSSGSCDHGWQSPESGQQEFVPMCDIHLTVEKTFVHFHQCQVSESSLVAHSAPGGPANSAQPKNPRRWNAHV
eukprot:TRINITY_DN60232_c0_g1_i1.p1 TRINITY_DN60232_c0_g1~~TRINITY_DN60232_c0_g1_i1.p1  ORF type:complete len:751 (-),score=107.29 TRINITY_DN60232_c0_g1_i1:392-2644(-)